MIENCQINMIRQKMACCYLLSQTCRINCRNTTKQMQTCPLRCSAKPTISYGTPINLGFETQTLGAN